MRTTQKLVIANWKSQKTYTEAMHWVAEVGTALKKKHLSAVLCPPFPFLAKISEEIVHHDYPLVLGVQDMSPFSAGAYTGAVSVRNVEGLNIRYAIVGHSERRKYFHETSMDVANKVELCIEEGITPIVCVDKGEYVKQTHAIPENLRGKCVIAYEPIDHIGTGVPEELETAIKVMKEIRVLFQPKAMLYGGSINPTTSKAFLSSKEIDGVLVGSDSVNAAHFIDLSEQSKS